MAHARIKLAPRACDVLDEQQQKHAVQVGREILSNVARHAHATEVRVSTEERDDHFLLVVEDDGVGFDPSTVTRGYGLTNVDARAKELGGVLEISACHPKGTRHVLRIPVSRRRESNPWVRRYASCLWTITKSSARAGRRIPES